jgi:hypothetical protein
MKTRPYGIRYGFDMDYLDSKKGCEAKVIRFDWLMISLRTSCVSYADA